MIRLTKLRYGPGYVQQPGSEVSLKPHEEAALIASGAAERVEAAVPTMPETAERLTKPRGRHNRRG